MIRIMKYGQIPESEIFSRVVPGMNVAGTVAEIIKTVQDIKS